MGNSERTTSGRNGHLLRQLGAGGLLVAICLYLVFDYLKGRDILIDGATAQRINPGVEQAIDQIDDLHEWHDRVDADGIPLWYVPRSLSKAIEEQIVVLKELANVEREQTRILDRIDQRAEIIQRQSAAR